MDKILQSAASAAPDARPEFMIRPGVRFPDWDCIRSPDAEAALLTMFRVARVERRWTDYSALLDRIRIAILRAFATRGHCPDVAELASETGVPTQEVKSALAELARRDLVVLGEGGRLTGAYPFTANETRHSVRRSDLVLRAMCAIDALGVGAMLGEDTEVLSTCRACVCPIAVKTSEEGMELDTLHPPEAVIWVGEVYSGNCGATSLCDSIAFFCSDEHLQEWRSSAEAVRGHRLTVEDAHQVGCAIFRPALLGTGVD